MGDVNDAMVRHKDRAKVLATVLEGGIARNGYSPALGDAVTIHGKVTAVHDDGTVVVTPEAVSA